MLLVLWHPVTFRIPSPFIPCYDNKWHYYNHSSTNPWLSFASSPVSYYTSALVPESEICSRSHFNEAVFSAVTTVKSWGVGFIQNMVCYEHFTRDDKNVSPVSWIKFFMGKQGLMDYLAPNVLAEVQWAPQLCLSPLWKLLQMNRERKLLEQSTCWYCRLLLDSQHWRWS